MSVIKSRVFGSIENGDIVFRLYTPADEVQAMQVYNDSFFQQECVSAGCRLNEPTSHEGRHELIQLSKSIVVDGVSIVAEHLPSQKIVGVCFNKIQVAGEPGAKSFFERFNDKCKSPNAKRLLQLMIDVDSLTDLFQQFDAKQLFEFVFLATHVEYQRKSIGRLLIQYSIELARDLKNQTNLEYYPAVCVNYRPVAGSAIFTSEFSIKIGRSLGFERFAEVSYGDYEFDGEPFAARIDPQHKTLELVGIKL